MFETWFKYKDTQYNYIILCLKHGSNIRILNITTSYVVEITFKKGNISSWYVWYRVEGAVVDYIMKYDTDLIRISITRPNTGGKRSAT